MFHAMRGGWLLPSAIALLVLVHLSAGRTAYGAIDTFTVNFAGDHAPGACEPLQLPPAPFKDCTLREAIIAANADSAGTTINFNVFPNGFPSVITVNSDGQGILPAITTAIKIDGTTEPDGRPSITQSGLPSSASSDGFKVNHQGVTIQGLAIYGFPSAAIETTNNNTFVYNNYIGTNAAGTSGGPGNGFGVMMVGAGAHHNWVGDLDDVALRNIISGNGTGVRIDNAGVTNRVVGNLIGTDATGSSAIPNNNGVVIVNSTATIGGSASPNGEPPGNTISGNTIAGIQIFGSGTGSVVQGNRIGVNSGNVAAIPNGNGTDESGGIVLDSDGSIIGGTSPAQRNAIAGNNGAGIWITANSSGNVIQGNTIGTVFGSSALPNDVGITMHGAQNNVIGGTTVEERNYISGNAGDGVQMKGGASGNILEGNYIGANSLGTGALPNFGGGVVIEDSPDNTIGGITGTTPGGPCTGACNLISGNPTGARSPAATRPPTLRSNFIGTDASGQAPLPNCFFGVRLADGAHDNGIGGTRGTKETSSLETERGSGRRPNDDRQPHSGQFHRHERRPRPGNG